MKKYNFICIAIPLFLCLATSLAQAQTDILKSTIAWKATVVTMLEDSTEVIIECDFVTKSDRKIEMKIGSKTKYFSIEKTVGEWVDINENGSMTYYGNSELTKRVFIERSSEGLFFTLDLTGIGGQKHTFNIKSYAVN